MPSSCRVNDPTAGRASSDGRKAAAKPTRISARSRRPGKVPGIAWTAARSGSSTRAVFLPQRPAMGAADAGKRCANQRRCGWRWIAGQQVQIAQCGVAQPQGVDRKPVARFRREKGGDRLGRGRQRGLAHARHTSR